MEHMFLVKNEDLLKELQLKEQVKDDDKYMMVEVRVHPTKSSITIQRFNFDDMFAPHKNRFEKYLWKVIPVIRTIRTKLGLVWRTNRRSLKQSRVALQGLLAVLNPECEEYKDKTCVSSIYQTLYHHYTWSYNNTQLIANCCNDTHWAIVNYLCNTGNLELGTDISNVWMKSKLTDKDRKAMRKRELDETIKLVKKIE